MIGFQPIQTLFLFIFYFYSRLFAYYRIYLYKINQTTSFINHINKANQTSSWLQVIKQQNIKQVNIDNKKVIVVYIKQNSLKQQIELIKNDSIIQKFDIQKRLLNRQQIVNLKYQISKERKIDKMDKGDQVDIDKIINKLLDKTAKDTKLLQSQIRALCLKSRQIFLSQPMLLQLQAPIKICGDIHGQYSDLIKLFEYGGYPGDQNYLFLGDYVDRGKQSIQCIALLLAYKVKYPQNFFLLRGNHQCSSINRIYGFYDQCKRKYNLKLWKLFSDVFNVMPVCALVDQKILCMHGGLSPQLQNLQQILKIVRPVEVPDQGLLCDLLWSDPEKGIEGWNQNQRGVSFIFGANVVSNFLKQQDIDLVCRAHQVVQEGYQFFAKRQLVTIFSAPNYCGQFDNSGAIMSVDESLMCSFQILKSSKKKK